MSHYYFILFLFIFFACGKASKMKDEAWLEEETREGTYSALLMPSNSKISSHYIGKVTINHYGDEFSVMVRLDSSEKGERKQFLHQGEICPHKDQDVNQDGIINVTEASRFLGKKIMPFDDDISSIKAGSGLFPHNSYLYKRDTSYSLMISDPDFKNNDFHLERKTLVIYGESRWGEVPVACGVLTRISSTPVPEEPSDSTPAPPLPRPDPPREDLPLPDDEIPEESENHSTWWERLRQRWRDWWNRRDE